MSKDIIYEINESYICLNCGAEFNHWKPHAEHIEMCNIKVK